MSSFCPPLRKRPTTEHSTEHDKGNGENLIADEFEGDLRSSEGQASEQASTQNSQEVLSCGFLPPKQRKRTPFRPPLRDVSPAQSYISRILSEDGVEDRGVTPSGLTSSFQLAPLNNVDNKENEECTLLNEPKKHRYYYHIGNRRIEQPVKNLAQKRPAEVTTSTSKLSASTLCVDKNESRLKIFEFQLSQAARNDKPACETSFKPYVRPLTQLQRHNISVDIYHAVKKAREEIKKIRKRYAAKKVHSMGGTRYNSSMVIALNDDCFNRHIEFARRSATI